MRLLVGWLTGWLVGWLVDWLVGWLVAIGWLAGWLVGRVGCSTKSRKRPDMINPFAPGTFGRFEAIFDVCKLRPR